MNYLYISRHFNRGGHHILEYLLRESAWLPQAILLPARGASDPLNHRGAAVAERRRYAREVEYFGGRPLRFMKSIVLLAEEYGIPVISMESVKNNDARVLLESLKMDLYVLGGGWPEFIPRRLIALPRLGIINTHPSLLPEFRGTDVHRWQICRGVDKSGVTIHYVDEKFDTGDILGQIEVPIGSDDTPQALADKTGRAAGPLMAKVLSRIADNAPHRAPGRVQEYRDDSSRYFSRWRWDDREFLRIDWRRTAEQIHNFVRACAQESYKYNGPFFFVNNREYILRKSSLERHDGGGRAGEIIRVDPESIAVRCGRGDEALAPIQVQKVFENNPRAPAITAGELVENERLKVGDSMGSPAISREDYESQMAVEALGAYHPSP